MGLIHIPKFVPVQGGQLKACESIVIEDFQVLRESLKRRFVVCDDGIVPRKRPGKCEHNIVMSVQERKGEQN